MKQLTAADIMSRNPVMVRHDQSIAEVLAVLKSKGISGVPVLDDSGSLCGLVSLKDIAFDALFRNADGSGESGYRVVSGEPSIPVESPQRLFISSSLKARDIMTPMVFTVQSDCTLNEIADDMSKGRVHRLVVLENDAVVGVVSSLDLLKVIRTCE